MRNEKFGLSRELGELSGREVEERPDSGVFHFSLLISNLLCLVQ